MNTELFRLCAYAQGAAHTCAEALADLTNTLDYQKGRVSGYRDKQDTLLEYIRTARDNARMAAVLAETLASDLDVDN